MPVSQSLLDPLSHLRDAMLALKDRVREAVSAELSRIVGQTVQDVMQRALQRTEPPREPRRHDPWDDEIPDDEDEDDEVDNRRAIEPSPPSPSCLRNGWLVAAGQLLFWCLTRPIRPWWPVLLLTGAGVAAYSQQPIVWAVFTAVKTASELLTP